MCCIKRLSNCTVSRPPTVLRCVFNILMSYLVGSCSAFLAMDINAAGFSSQGDHDKLAEHTIVFVGTLTEQKNFMDTSPQEPLRLPYQAEKLYGLGEYCFYSSGHFGYTPAMVLVDKYGQPKLVIFHTNGSDLEIRLHPVRLLNCKDIRNRSIQNSLDDLKAKIESLERQRQQNRQLLNELQDRERKRKAE